MTRLGRTTPAAVVAAAVIVLHPGGAGAGQPARRVPPAEAGAATPQAQPVAVTRATQALAAGELDRAAALAADHLRTHPRSAAARVVLARVHLERNDLESAYRELDRAQRESPRDIDVLYYLGLVAGVLAADRFDALVRATPRPARGHQLVAESLEAQERRSEAERAYEAAIDAQPDLLEALLALARLKRIRLDCDGAKALYARAEAVRPTFDGAYGLGSCLLREQDFAAARTQLARAVARDPRSGVALVGLGAALLGLGRPTEALPVLKRAVAMEPAMDEGWYVLARAHQAAGQSADAERAFAAVERLRRERAQ